MDYTYKRVTVFHPLRVLRTARILHRCGKDMAKKYDLHHWDNSWTKTLAVVLLTACKGKTYLVTLDQPVATFTYKQSGDTLYFEKLATLPECAGQGIGGHCMAEIERIAKEKGCRSVSMDVYDRSEHAKQFYLHKGYVFCGEIKTRKYVGCKMKKDI